MRWKLEELWDAASIRATKAMKVVNQDALQAVKASRIDLKRARNKGSEIKGLALKILKVRASC
jgi:hypothetical protein